MKPVIAAAAFALVVVVVVVGCRTAQQSSTPAHDFQVAVTDRGFEPAETVIPRGQAVTLVVTRKTDQTCAKEILIPALNERRTLPLNQAVRIDVPKGVADTLNYICGMHMLGGTIAAK